MTGAPCRRCGKPANFEAIGGRDSWRYGVLNWASRVRIKLRRRWRPFHLECLEHLLWEYGTDAWAQVRTLRKAGAR